MGTVKKGDGSSCIAPPPLPVTERPVPSLSPSQKVPDILRSRVEKISVNCVLKSGILSSVFKSQVPVTERPVPVTERPVQVIERPVLVSERPVPSLSPPQKVPDFLRYRAEKIAVNCVIKSGILSSVSKSHVPVTERLVPVTERPVLVTERPVQSLSPPHKVPDFLPLGVEKLLVVG